MKVDDATTQSSFVSAEAVEQFVRSQADCVYDPCSMAIGLNVGLAEMGLIRDVTVAPAGPNWEVWVNIRLTSPGCQYFFYFEEQLQARLLAHPQIVRADVTWDHRLDWTPEDLSSGVRARIAQRMSLMSQAPQRSRPTEEIRLEQADKE